MEQVIVTFNFDPETKLVSDVHCTVDGIESKKKTTRKVKDVVNKDAQDSEPIVTLEANKVIFNAGAVNALDIQYEDRVVIKWVAAENKRMVPIVGKNTAFGEESTGNKITKSNTMTYKGNANIVLAEYGSEFTLKPYEEGIYRLIPVGGEPVIAESLGSGCETFDLDAITQQAENTEPELLVNNNEEDLEIKPLQYQLL